MASEWKVDSDYWYPLVDVPRGDLLAFDAMAFGQAVARGPLHRVLEERGIARVFELREGGSAFEIELRDLEPTYTGDEGYWCTKELDWLLYASHEGSLTVAGEWLIRDIKRVWQSWEKHVWHPFS